MRSSSTQVIEASLPATIGPDPSCLLAMAAIRANPALGRQLRGPFRSREAPERVALAAILSSS